MKYLSATGGRREFYLLTVSLKNVNNYENYETHYETIILALAVPPVTTESTFGRTGN